MAGMALPPNNVPGGNHIYGTPRQDEVNLNKLQGVEVWDGIPRILDRPAVVVELLHESDQLVIRAPGPLADCQGVEAPLTYSKLLQINYHR